MATYTIVDWLYFSGARGVDGNPVSSGSVSFYNPGSTSVAVPVFADSTGTPLSQPVALDAAGRATVYVNSPCEIIVKDAFGATVRTATNSIAVIGDQVAVSWDSTTKTLSQALTEIAAFMHANAPSFDSYYYDSTTVQNPVFTIFTDYTLQFKTSTYDGNSATVTVNLPSSFLVAEGTRFKLSIYNQGAGTIANAVFGTGIQAAPLTALASGKTAVADFIGNPSGIRQVEAWYVY